MSAKHVPAWGDGAVWAHIDRKQRERSLDDRLAPIGVPERKRPTRPAPNYVSAAQLADMQLEPIRWAVYDILPEGIYILAARPKIGKSWLALQIALAIARGERCLGKRTTPGAVLYLALEDNARRLKRRLGTLGVRADVPGLAFATEFPRVNEGGLDALLQYADARKDLRLIVVDTFERMRPTRAGRNANVYAEDYPAGSAFRRLADEKKVSVLIVTHTRKAEADDPIDTVSGSLGLTGAADGVLVIERARGEERAQLHLIGRDLEFEGAFAVKFDRASCTWSMLGEAHEVGRSEAREELLCALRQSAKPLSLRQLVDATGKRYDAVQKMLRRMCDEGEVIREDKGYALPPASGGLFEGG